MWSTISLRQVIVGRSRFGYSLRGVGRVSEVRSATRRRYDARGENTRLKPGAIRELHWHEEAAWAYMLAGRTRKRSPGRDVPRSPTRTSSTRITPVLINSRDAGAGRRTRSPRCKTSPFAHMSGWFEGEIEAALSGSLNTRCLARWARCPNSTPPEERRPSRRASTATRQQTTDCRQLHARPMNSKQQLSSRAHPLKRP